MLTFLKDILKTISLPLLYFSDITISLLSIFKRAEWGLFFLVAMIPQPNIWYKLSGYPMANNFIDFLFFGVLLGIVNQKKGFAKTTNSTIIYLLMIVSYFSLWNSSLRFSLALPFTTANVLLPDWKNYVEMIFLYFLVLNVIKGEDQQKALVVLMSFVILFLAIRSYRNFSGGSSFQYEKREGGPFEAVGLGANHFGAFIAHYCTLILGLFLFDDDKKRKKLFGATVLFGLHPLFYSYSRGAYLAVLGGIGLFGLLKKRSLLILIIVILLFWQAILPVSVVDRIMMTKTETGELESSAGHRLNLWEHALELFYQNPVFGIGFGGFGFTVPAGELTDTHNFFMKTLSEQGVIGFLLLLIVLGKAFLSGWKLYRIGGTPFHQGLGFGFMGAVTACFITNMFGDRWSYFSLGGYFWVFWGLVDRAIIISQGRSEAVQEERGHYQPA